MQGTNVLFGQIAVVLGIVIAGVWGATQWTAAALGYQLRLGSPWFDFLGTPIYHPWRLFEWWFFFDAYAPRVFDTGGAIAGARANRAWSRPTVRPAGRTRMTFARQASHSRPACSSASTTASTCAIKGQSMS
jgi:type IV secretory pathway TraG/TraD family ATPase VirD4